MSMEKSCGAVIYRKLNGDLEFLAVKSKVNGHWGFPKGHVEEGETEKETAKREVLEETGLNITLVEGFRTKIEYSLAEDIRKEVIFFIGKTSDQCVKIQEEEIGEYRWLNYSEMLDLLTFDSNKSVLKEAQEYFIV
ncbi:bis(5'-nucleosyl)-tetraphosphatase [Oceanirhabdus seepicola]|uniref:Bis(5'-nucleosyl)-tetraphosphatase [asymmetrical] n=1 Tax=Oceanirhabdus seepicola TaxID=2828781 RepID=A0A9J6P0H9_9CLOT|nr:NUDIX domain-containing protein [Oceanirhabdus seepicola]MCM1988944.1 NUDIX domain-containing protein [Oceanirhabdus seepicola]